MENIIKMSRKTQISLQLFNALQYLKEETAPTPSGNVPLPQQSPPQAVANSNPLQPLPGSGGTNPAASSGGPVSSTGEPLTVDTMIDRFNVIRGGRSFSEPEIYGQLITLYKGLGDQEKVSLDGILTEIGKIVIKQPQPSAAGGQMRGTNPAQPPPNMARGAQAQSGLDGAMAANAQMAGGAPSSAPAV